MRVWQQDDPLLQEHLQAASRAGTIVRGQERLELCDGLLYWVEREGERRLAVPQKWRRKILELAHDIPMAGHLAEVKMKVCMRQRFWWPGWEKEIAEYCSTCPQCQKTQGKPHPGAELIPMPLMDHPFQRIGLDIVGTLMRLAGGHIHILVIIDYAMRCPEAILLRLTTAKALARVDARFL